MEHNYDMPNVFSTMLVSLELLRMVFSVHSLATSGALARFRRRDCGAFSWEAFGQVSSAGDLPLRIYLGTPWRRGHSASEHPKDNFPRLHVTNRD